MTGGIVLVVVIILFICVIIGFNNDVKQRVEARERKEASERRINNLLNSLPYAQTTNEAYNIFTALSAEYRSFYNSGYYFQGYRQVERIIAKAEKIYLARCKELQPKPQKREKTKEEIYRDLQNSVEITEEYYTRLFVVITPEEWSKDYGVISRSNKLVRLERKYFEELERRYQPTKEFNENLSKVCALNNKGIALEKDGNIDEAIATYEEGILIPYKARHSYDRLLVLYRKRKDYENEKRVCLAAIDRFPEEAKYKERLIKIEAKITKANKP